MYTVLKIKPARWLSQYPGKTTCRAECKQFPRILAVVENRETFITNGINYLLSLSVSPACGLVSSECRLKMFPDSVGQLAGVQRSF